MTQDSSSWLCENPACNNHARIVRDAELELRNEGRRFRFVEGFQMPLSVSQHACLNPVHGLRLCGACNNAVAMVERLSCEAKTPPPT